MKGWKRAALLLLIAILVATAVIAWLRQPDPVGVPPPPPMTDVPGQVAAVTQDSCPPTPACEPMVSPPPAPKADPALREQRRFNRNDRDKDGVVAKEEYLHSRQRSFDKMDENGDGHIDFTEYSVKQRERFDNSDCDSSRTLTPAEFASTATRKDAPEPDC
ncbi:histidine kinase [Pacificimonas sp. ICDLI1SI03]